MAGSLIFLLRSATVSNYNIFLQGTVLFAYLEFYDEAAVDSLKVHSSIFVGCISLLPRAMTNVRRTRMW